MSSKLDHPAFRDDDAAREYLESVRWPNGPVCPHCGGQKAYKVKSKAARPGVYKCAKCRKQFTVTVGTLFERSKVPLHLWVQATFLLCSSKKGISSHQLHRILGVAYQTAWFMTHRLREAMRDGDLFTPRTPMGGKGKIVEADETYFGGRQRGRNVPYYREGVGWITPRGANSPKAKGRHRQIVALVERDGNARSFHVDKANQSTVRDILVRNVRRESALMTDEAMHYRKPGKEFASHERVQHGIDEYVRGNVHTNTIEGFFSIFKRGMKGVYQHCSEKHLHRYLAEFDFRYNMRKVNDVERTETALANIEGRRLTYRHSLAAV